MNPDLNKANQEHKDLDNRSYLIGFEEGYNKAIEEIEEEIDKLQKSCNKADRIIDGITAFSHLLQAINKLKK